MDPVERLVEAQVHEREHQAEEGGQPQVGSRMVARHRPRDRPQDDCREQHAQENGSSRTEVVEQLGGEGRTHLHGGDAHQYETRRGYVIERRAARVRCAMGLHLHARLTLAVQG